VRRHLFCQGLFGGQRFVALSQLEEYGPKPLADLGLTSKDRLRVRAAGQGQDAFLLLENPAG
jgi:hypothetical protein